MTEAAAICEAVARLRAGELVAFPTETVYGLGADARNTRAVERIYQLKGRPSGHPLIVHVAEASALSQWASHVPDVALRLAERFWPGPLTLILPRAAGVPDAVTGGQSSVGLRVPSHPVARRLLEAFAEGIAAPSANRYGRVSPTSAAHVREEFGADSPFILEGAECSVGLESTIVSLLGEPLLLRPGGISVRQLESVIGPLRRAASGEGPRAPGTTVAHYAPRTPLMLVPGADLDNESAGSVAVLARRPSPTGFGGLSWINAGDEPDGYARALYANLRTLDRAGAERILVESPPGDPAWEAIRDRLARSAAACSTRK
jgi:L-threonylcarbamoyladenylate synthase